MKRELENRQEQQGESNQSQSKWNLSPETLRSIRRE